MKKSIISLILCLNIIIQSMACFAYEIEENFNNSEVEELIQTVSTTHEIPNINSRAAVVVDRNSKRILYGKNENDKRPMASTTKIITGLLVIEKGNFDDIVTVSKKAAGTGGSRLGLKVNDKISVRNLLYGLMLVSGNDAAVALAEYISGDVVSFADLMNEKANEIGLKNTHYVTPHGLDSDEHYTTAYELAILTDYALKNKIFADIVKTKNYIVSINGYSKNLNNTNELLGYLNGVYGVKTGFTNGAGRCLVSAVKRRNLDIICVVMGADTKKDRTKDSIKLIEYSFENYKNEELKNIITNKFNAWKDSNKIEVYKGIKEEVEVILEENDITTYPIKSNDIIEIEIVADYELEAPININTNIGKLKVNMNGNSIYEINIKTKETIERKKIKNYFIYLIKEYGNYLQNI